MGLDMYLEARKYVSGLDHNTEEHNALYRALVESVQGHLCHASMPSVKSVEVLFNVMYWRNSIQIHNWFIDNCAYGTDECQDIEVSIDDLKKLRDFCGEVASMFPEGYGDDEKYIPELSENLINAIGEKLPPSNAYFFGSTEFELWYYRTVVRMHEELSRLIEWDEAEAKAHEKEYSGWYYVYRASW